MLEPMRRGVLDRPVEPGDDSGGRLRSIAVTEAVVENAEARALSAASGLRPTRKSVTLGGIADNVSVYEIL
ncbi:hypothetical protein JQ633_11710 [Bradyrhizobium tropiciagri]|uniref:hypothetical protein n=1 Tax=Bradyrhizobium tropiciagri TaxID=312253 RepID=UPI001BA6C457|nr:hypothetical protein [Bradyrhizobium tropiciagri]MBR0871028.1 hypothetical protein [Bradyrhizobium tropiciagri]